MQILSTELKLNLSVNESTIFYLPFTILHLKNQNGGMMVEKKSLNFKFFKGEKVSRFYLEFSDFLTSLTKYKRGSDSRLYFLTFE